MRTPLLLTVGLALAGLVHAAVMPCLWDRDTRAMERQRFPSVLELVTGKFLRHSDEYYRWRVEDRTARLDAGERTPELLDDLAVAHSKLGEDRRAIELMELQEELHPGRYETLANRGTFHVHAGDLEEGARLIERALEVNPDAHFGRERYQLWLVRYAQRRRAMEGAAPLPLHPSSETLGGGDRQNFWGFVAEQEGLDPRTPGEHTDRIAAAVQGVAGMLRFGNHDSPVLLEALSDLLLADWNTDAKGLAARALLRASAACEDPAARAAYRRKAKEALQMQTPSPGESRSITLEELEGRLAVELEEAGAWWEELRAAELGWIADGVDVDARFEDRYRAAPRVSEGGAAGGPDGRQLLGVGMLALGLVAAASALRASRRARAA
jgi:tetratricopeptide (TPR) repeat protein